MHEIIFFPAKCIKLSFFPEKKYLKKYVCQTCQKFSDRLPESHLVFYLAISHIPIQLFQCIYQWGKTYCFLFLREKFRSRAMLFDETHIELLDTDLFLKDNLLDKMYCNEEKWSFFNINTDSRISLCSRTQY